MALRSAIGGPDALDQIPALARGETRRNVSASYYFLLRRYHRRDANYDLGQPGLTDFMAALERQGLEVGYIGKIGYDPAGNEVVRVLRREGVATDRIVYDPKLTTDRLAELIRSDLGLRAAELAVERPGPDQIMRVEMTPHGVETLVRDDPAEVPAHAEATLVEGPQGRFWSVSQEEENDQAALTGTVKRCLET